MKHLPYALFDMDGTLVESMTYWAREPEMCCHQLYKESGAACSQSAFVAFNINVRKAVTYRDLLEALAEVGVQITERELARKTEESMLSHYENDIDVKPGVIPLLEELQAAGTKMGIVTMTPHYDVDACLKKTGLGKYFSFVLTPEDTSDGSGKEKPEIFDIALKKLGCRNASECMFFEDSYYAVYTAKNMGFYMIGVYDDWSRDPRVEQLSDEFLVFRSEEHEHE